MHCRLKMFFLQVKSVLLATYRWKSTYTYATSVINRPTEAAFKAMDFSPLTDGNHPKPECAPFRRNGRVYIGEKCMTSREVLHELVEYENSIPGHEPVYEAGKSIDHTLLNIYHRDSQGVMLSTLPNLFYNDRDNNIFGRRMV